MNRNRRIASIEASAECARDMGVDTSCLDFAIRAWYANLEAVQYYAEESAKVADTVDAMNAQIAAIIKRRDNMQKDLDGMDNARSEHLDKCDDLMHNVVKEYTAEIRNASIAASAQYSGEGSSAWDEHAAQKSKHAQRRKDTAHVVDKRSKLDRDVYDRTHDCNDDTYDEWCAKWGVHAGDYAKKKPLAHAYSGHKRFCKSYQQIRDSEFGNGNHAWDGNDSEIENQNTPESETKIASVFQEVCAAKSDLAKMRANAERIDHEAWMLHCRAHRLDQEYDDAQYECRKMAARLDSMMRELEAWQNVTQE